MDSNLVFAARAARGDGSVSSFANAISMPKMTDGVVTVDISGVVTKGLLAAVAATGGTVISQSQQFGLVHASVPLDLVEILAARSDVSNIRSATGALYNGPHLSSSRPSRKSALGTKAGVSLIGALTSQGYVTHGSNLVVNNQNISGVGVTVGVLSDSASADRIAALIATGDLPANTTVLPGQAGPSIADGGTDEGTAMMEIIHDYGPRSEFNLCHGGFRIGWFCRQHHCPAKCRL